MIIAGIIVGLVIALQMNSKLLSAKDTNLSEQKDFLAIKKSLEVEQNELKTELTSLREEEKEKSSLLSEDIQLKLKESQKQAGFTAVQGEGLVLRLAPESGFKSSEKMAEFLQNIVNLMLSVQADAISVNGYRVVFKTPIISVGENILLKNFYITDPFEITVIGNPDFLLSAFEVREAFKPVREAVSRGEISLEVKKASVLEVPAYIY